MFCKLSINSLKFVVTPEKFIFSNFILNRSEGISRYSTANKLKYDQNTFAEQFNNEFIQAPAYPTDKHMQCLRSKFGIDHFKSPQWRVINSLMEEKRDNFVIMPSGYGKSLCYQFPAVFTNGLTVVISPLISLMQDQVKSLQALNIPACFLGPAQPDKTVYQKLLNGHYRIVYITPESALSVNGLDLLETLHYQVKITLIAIDEAHCILHWGNDFRPAYGNLDVLRMKLPSVPVIALTATATSEEKYGIFHMLALRNPQEVCSGYDRTNLYFMTREMTKEPYGDISKVLYEDKKRYSIEDGSVIIYCLTKKGTEKLAHLLNGMGIVCRAYHAGLNNIVRKSIMDDFISGKTKVIVATTAFGMGINKLDVRIVIHYGTSLSMEGYYQEVGRAGRDGKAALCVMYHSLADFVTHRYINVANSKSETTYCNAEMRNNIMKRYVSTTLCRRQFIGNHFDKTSPIAYPTPQSCCDNCSNNNGYSDYLHDLTDDVELFLRGIQSFHPKSFGPNMIVSLLMGSTDKNKLKIYQDNVYFGTGAKRNEQWWKQIAFILEMEKYIKITNIIVGSALFSKVILDAKGKQWLRDKFNNRTSPIKLPLSKEMQQLLNNKIS